MNVGETPSILGNVLSENTFTPNAMVLTKFKSIPMNPFRFLALLVSCLFAFGACPIARAGGKVTHNLSPLPRLWSQSGTHFYKMMGDTTTGTGVNIENGQIRFKVGSTGAAFRTAGTVEIREGSVNGTVVASGLAQNSGATETGWITYTFPADFTSGSRIYFARRTGSSTVYTDFGIRVTANAPPQIGAVTLAQAGDGSLTLSFVASDAESDGLAWKASLYREGTNVALLQRSSAATVAAGTITVPAVTVSEQQSLGLVSARYFWLVQLYDDYHSTDTAGDAKVSPYVTFNAASAPLPAPAVSVNSNSFADLTSTSSIIRWSLACRT